MAAQLVLLDSHVVRAIPSIVREENVDSPPALDDGSRAKTDSLCFGHYCHYEQLILAARVQVLVESQIGIDGPPIHKRRDVRWKFLYNKALHFAGHNLNKSIFILGLLEKRVRASGIHLQIRIVIRFTSVV